MFTAVVSIVGIGLLVKKNGLRFWREKTFKEAWLEKKASGETDEEESPEQKAAAQAARWQYEFDLLKDPKTGKIPANIFKEEMKQAMSLPVSLESFSVRNGVVRTANGVNTPTSNTYLKAGPNNIGGRTRAFAFDKFTIMSFGTMQSAPS